jgi:VanZ family protein
LQSWSRWTITLAWAGLIIMLSTGTFGGSLSEFLLREILGFLHLTVTPQRFALLHFLFRKSAHLTEYGIFAVFLYHCFLNSNQTEWSARTAVWAIVGAGLYSLSDEFHQIFVPGRGAALTDCGIDTVGAAMGMLIVFLWTRIFGFRFAPAKTDNLPAIST